MLESTDKSVPLFVLFLPLFLMPGSSLVDYNHVFSFLLLSLLVISIKTFTSSALLPPPPLFSPSVTVYKPDIIAGLT